MKKTNLLYSLILGLSLPSSALLFTGCPGEGGTDAGDGDGDGDGDDPGETCTSAIEIQLDTPVTGTTAGMANNYSAATAGCTQSGAGPDTVYKVKLPAEGSITATVEGDGDFDPVVYIRAGTCTVNEEGACNDDAGTTESATVAVYPADEWAYIIVDSYVGVGGNGAAGGSFTLTVTTEEGGICIEDGLADFCGTSAEDPCGLGSDYFDSVGLIPFYACPGAPDYWSLGHLGGTLDIIVEGLDGASPKVALYNANVDEAGLAETPLRIDFTQGDVVAADAATYSADAPAGFYYLVIDHSDDGNTAEEYDITVDHGCLGDDYDFALTQVDDQSPRFAQDFVATLGYETDHSLCGGDIDGFNLYNLVDGDVTFTVYGGSTFEATVDLLDTDGMATPLVLDTDYTVAVDGENLVVSMHTRTAGERFFVKLMLPESAPADTAFAYYADAVFTGVDGTPPANDECANAEAIVPTTDGLTIIGRTAGATDDVWGDCTGEADATPAITLGQGAPDVFYTITAAQGDNYEFVFDGEDPFFYGSIYLIKGMCWAEGTTPELVTDKWDRVLCRDNDKSYLRAGNLDAGDYILVVDGVFFNDVDIGTKGAFELTATSYPTGFPPPAACAAATALTIPAVGQTTELAVDTTDGSNDIPDLCGDQSLGNEAVFILTPTEAMNVTFRTADFGGTEDDSFDTMLEVREEDCIDGLALVCNDDVDPGVERQSEIDVALEAGKTYYLILDGWGENDNGDTTLYVTRNN